MSSDTPTQILTIGQATGLIRRTLEDKFSELWLQGEISNLTKHSSGHWYFSLKDNDAQISAVMFRRQNASVNFVPTSGMQVLARGGISVYPPHGRYQIIIQELLPAGLGDLHIALEALKAKLSAEGLFNSDRKKPLPRFPETIGIVTSPTGAAIRDMLQVMARRYPMAQIQLYPVRVQGAGAAAEVVAGIEHFNSAKLPPDLLIVGRGGGSLEDLWAFNEEILARAIAASRIPIVSAVGHEIDTTISDLVADLRAPTPSAAAELVVPAEHEIFQSILRLKERSNQALVGRIEKGKGRLRSVQGSYGLRRPMVQIQTTSQHLDNVSQGLNRRIQLLLDRRGHQLELLSKRTQALSPDETLARGYAMVSGPDGSVVKNSRNLKPGDEINIRLGQGKVKSEVKALDHDSE